MPLAFRVKFLKRLEVSEEDPGVAMSFFLSVQCLPPTMSSMISEVVTHSLHSSKMWESLAQQDCGRSPGLKIQEFGLKSELIS